MELDTENALVLFGSVQAFVLCLGQLVEKNPSKGNYYLAAAYFCIATLMLYLTLFISGFFFRDTAFFQFHTPFMFWIGPLIFALFKFYIEGETEFQKRELLHFLAGAVSLIIMVPFHLQTPEQKIARLKLIFVTGHFDVPKVLLILGLVAMSAYSLEMLRRLLPLIRWEIIKSEPQVRLLIVAPLCIIFFQIFLMLTWLTGSTHFIAVSGVLVGMVMMLFYLMSRRYPQIWSDIRKVLEREKGKYSFLTAIDTQKVGIRLRTLMDEEEIFKDYELTLPALAEHLGLSVHQLSEYLNRIEKQQFFHFINGYRVRYAQDLFRSKPAVTILSVAYESGFNSKTAFNNAFRRVTGMTPREFKNQL